MVTADDRTEPNRRKAAPFFVYVLFLVGIVGGLLMVVYAATMD